MIPDILIIGPGDGGNKPTNKVENLETIVVDSPRITPSLFPYHSFYLPPETLYTGPVDGPRRPRNGKSRDAKAIRAKARKNRKRQSKHKKKFK